MATITASAAGGKWSEAGAWEGGVEPKEGDDVVLGAGSGSITVAAESKCRSIEATSYKKTLKIEAAQKLKIGTTTSNGGLCINLGAGMTMSGSGTINFVSTSGTAEKIKSNGKEWGGSIHLFFEGIGGVWEFADALTSGFELSLEKGEIKTAGATVTAKSFFVAGTSKINLGASTLKLNRTSAGQWNIATTATLEAGTSTIELEGTGETSKEFVGGKKTYNRVVVLGDNMLIREANTFAELAINTRGNSFKGTSFEKTVAQTITGSFTTNALPGEKILLKSQTAAKAWKLKVTSGVVEVSNVEIEDSTAEGGAIWIDRGVGGQLPLNRGNNTGWRFMDEEVTAQQWQQRPPNLYTPSGLNSTLLDPFPPFFPVAVPSTTHEFSHELSATQGQSVSLERQVTRALTVSQAQAATKVTALSRALTTTQGQAVSAVRSLARTLSVAQAQSVARVAAVARTLTITQGQGVSLARVLARLLTVAQGQAATLARALARTLSTSQGQSATRSVTPTRNLALEQGQAVTKAVSLTRSLSATQVASSSTISKPLTRVVSAEQGQVVVCATSVGRVLASTQGQAAALAKALARTLTLSQPSGASFGRALARTLVLSQGQEASQTAKGTLGLTLEVGQGQAVSRTTTVVRSLPVAQSGTPTLARSPSRSLASTTAQSARLARSLTRQLAAATASSASLARTPVRVLGASSTQSAYLAHSLTRTLVAGQAQTATLEASVIELLLSPLGASGAVSVSTISSAASASRSILSRVESPPTSSEVR